MLGVSDGVTDDLRCIVRQRTKIVKVRDGAYILKEDLENTSGLLVDETGDTLDTTTTSEATNSGLGDT